MNTKIFIFKVSLMNEDGNYDYVKVMGAYFNREDALKVVNDHIEYMKKEWINCKFHRHNADSVYLKSETGLVKWYEVEELKVK